MAEETNKPPLLELTPQKLVVSLRVSHAGRVYRVCHLLRPPAPADWFAYEAALQPALEELPPAPDSDEPGYRLEMRAADAALELWSRLVLRVDGYTPLSGHDSSRADDLAADEGSAGRIVSNPASGVGGRQDWRELIPLSHKEAAVHALTLVAPAQPLLIDSPNGHFPLFAEEIPVVLEAAVAGLAYPRLVHRFRPPSVAHERAYRRLLAETVIVRGSRAPRALIPARLPALVRLYDQLILGVEGYAINTQPPASRLEVIQSMDAWHKRVAVQALFGDLAPETPVAEPGSHTRPEPAALSDELPG
ncbi:MAG: hypothetical protein HY653_07215 [Acidobacteria bacterium]|nr:hypothetical protein [Acidobacteriota bacterium]